MKLPRFRTRISARVILLLALVALSPAAATAQPPLPSIAEQKEAMLLAPRRSQAVPQPRRSAPSPSNAIDYWTQVVYSVGTSLAGEELLFDGLNHSTQIIALAPSPGNDIQPHLNRDATVVAFASDRDKNFEIYRVNSDGSNVQRLTNNTVPDYWPDWSPDSKQIVFSSGSSRAWNLYRIQADGSGLTPLTFDTKDTVRNIMPNWSPDGTTIIWVRRVQTGRNTFERTLWAMQADGTNARPLTGNLPFLSTPLWSPDGTRIAFDADVDGDGWNELATVRSDGSNLTLRHKSFQPNNDVWIGAWTPHSDEIVFSEVSYTIVGGKVVVLSQAYYRISMVNDLLPRTFGFSSSGEIDVGTTDPDPPQSSVQPLPAYSRASGFPVSWEFHERGTSWVEQADIQYRSNGAATWSDWRQAPYYEDSIGSDSASFSGAPGSTIAFRSRTTDAAGNVEAWPAGAGDTSTTLYATELGGRVLDNRAHPIPGALLQIAPALLNSPRSDVAGRYRGYAANRTSRSVSVSASGYGALPAATRAITPDQQLDLMLPPSATLLQNGTFEAAAQPNGWSSQGSLPIAISSAAHTGSRALTIGAACSAPCLASDTQSITTTPQIVVDDLGTTHMLWQPSEFSGEALGLRYSYRPAGQAWSATETVTTISGPFTLALDQRGTLHVVVSDVSDMHYLQRPQAGSWSAPVNLGPGGGMQIAGDAQGQVHLVYLCGNPTCVQMKALYRLRSAAGVWSQPKPFLDNATWYLDGSLAISRDGTLSFAWRSGSTPGIFLTTRYPDGAWSATEQIVGQQIDGMQLATDDTDTLHLMWVTLENPYQVVYSTSKRPGESWAPPLMVSKTEYGATMAVSGDGTAHIVRRGLSTGMVYYQKRPNANWSAGTPIAAGPADGMMLTSNRAGQLALAWSEGGVSTSNISVRTGTLAASGDEGAISQSVSIPANLHAPTLSFMYRLQGATAANGSQFEVAVGQGLSAQTVFSATQSVDWAPGWVDLSAWAGQTISITLRLHQAPGQPPAQLVLDDIALGAWLTPVISSITPAVPGLPGASRQLTIHGANFLATPTVSLGSVALTNVVWLNAETVQATLPTSVRPGRYDLRVTNPGGQAAIRASVLVGREIYLPLTLR